MWVKPDWDGNDGIKHTIFFSGNRSDDNSFFIYKSNTNRLVFNTSNDQGESSNSPSVNIAGWKNNTWHHIAFTWDGAGNKQIFIDGELRAADNTNKMPEFMHSKMYIGSSPWPWTYNCINGTIDELRVSSAVRGIHEFREYHNLGSYESSVLDAGEMVDWERLAWSSLIPPGTNLYLQTRISQDNFTWTNWTGNVEGLTGEMIYLDSDGEDIAAKQSRYIQWRAFLRSSDGFFTPALEHVNITWNYLPRVFNVSITPALPIVHDDLVINYSYIDPDDDPEGDTKFEWFVDRGTGFINSGFNNQILTANRTSFGEEWFCRITPHDGKSYGFMSESDRVIILAGPITRIQIIPENVTITSVGEVKFKAKAYDSEDNQVPTDFTWDVTGGGGIDQTGFFSAEETGVHGVSASAEGVTGIAVVTVIPSSLSKVEILPPNPEISTDDIIPFEAVVFDTKDNIIFGQTRNWSVSGGGIIGWRRNCQHPGHDLIW
jgi:hypothetical protein